METAVIAFIYILELLIIVQSWLMPMRDKQNKMDQELIDLKEELREIKKDIYIMDKGGVEE